MSATAKWKLVLNNQQWRIKLGETGPTLTVNVHTPGQYEMWLNISGTKLEIVRAASPEDAQSLALGWAAAELERAAGIARGAL